VTVWSLGQGPNGLAAWRLTPELPREIPAKTGRNCSALALSPDRVAVGARVSRTRGCDRADGGRLFAPTTRGPLRPLLEVGDARAAAFSADGRRLAIGGQVACAYDLATQALTKTSPADPISSIAYHPTAPLIVWATQQGKLESWQPGQ